MVDGPQAESIVSIKANAPEGATHYDRYNDYIRLHENKWSVWNSFHKTWQPMIIPTDESIAGFKIKPL